MSATAVFPLFYLPPVNYFGTLLTLQQEVLFEQFEHFPKQTFRNRAAVLSPNGLLDLIVPVVKGSSGAGHTKFKEVRISADFNWQKLHWRTLESCYRSSAYFEFYEDELQPFYTRKYDFLIDLNIDLLTWLLSKMKQKMPVNLTEEYTDGLTAAADFRNTFNKKQQAALPAKPYYQVFSDRTGFVPNLSVADLLFNQGPQAINYL